MFTNKKSIIFITKDVLKAADVILGLPPRIKPHIDVNWTLDSLAQSLATLKRYTGGSVRLLLDEDLAYVMAVSIPVTTTNEKETVKKKAQEIIPENLDEMVWDFKEILLVQKNSQDAGIKIVQIAAVHKTFFEKLSVAAIETRLNVEAIEPVSYALARQTNTEKEPLLIIYIAQTPLLITAYRGLVMTTKILDKLEMAPVRQLIEFVKEHFNLTINNLIVCGNAHEADLKLFESQGWQCQTKNLDPLVGLAIKKDLKGKDAKVLNLEILKISPVALNQSAGNKSVQIPIHKAKNPLVFGVMVAAFISLLLLAGFSILKIPTKEPIDKIKVIEPILPSTEVKITSPAAESSRFTIAVLNGSGKEGEAKKVSDMLQPLNYQVVKTGNADNYDYEKTEIRFKKKVDNAFIKNLDNVLQEEYSVTKGEKLKDDEEADVVIIVGKQ